MSLERVLGLRLSLVAGGQELAAEELIQPGEGNLSARIDRDTFLVTPTASDKSRLEVGDLIEVEVSGRQTPQRASSEVWMHRAIYQAFPTIHAVVHAHPVKVVALAEDGDTPNPALLAKGGTVLDRVAWVENYPRGSRSLAAAVAQGLAAAPACVLAGHGAVTVGATVEQAVLRMIRLERLALLTRGG